jgi:hypothetical protein
MATEAARSFVHEVAAAMPDTTIDYVRLEIGATRGDA